MVDETHGGNFWTTLPGILSGVAALLTAVIGGYALLRGGAPYDDNTRNHVSGVSAETPAPAKPTSDQPSAGTAAAPPVAEESDAIAGRLQDAATAASLGKALAAETDAPGGARSQDFENGSLYWHARTGAFIVRGLILGKYRDVGATGFGYPTTDELTTPDGVGKFNHFLFVYPNGFPEERSIYWRPNLGAHTVQGLIRAKWKETGWELGPLGYPVSDEYQAGAARRQDFEHGRIDWSLSSGAQVTLA